MAAYTDNFQPPELFQTPDLPPTGKSWRDALPIHPAAELFPLMSPDELKALAADIKKHGQRQPIAIIEKPRRRPDGTLHVSDPPLQEVLDGISRLDAMEAAGIKIIGRDGQLDAQIQRIEVDTDEIDPVAFVISCNIHRRHLTAEQKRDLIAKLIKATPEKVRPADRRDGEGEPDDRRDGPHRDRINCPIWTVAREARRQRWQGPQTTAQQTAQADDEAAGHSF